MELSTELLSAILAHQPMEITFPQLQGGAILEGVCYDALRKICAILRDDSLSDPECFAKIEEIVCIFEALDSGGGTRHDLG